MTANKLKQHDRSIYIDVEMSFWAGPPPPGMRQEIIEIGIVEMNLLTLEIIRERSHFVRPRRWDISERCSDLTGITADDIRHARPFPEVIASVAEEFAPETGLCCTWGNDAAVIASACQSHKLKSPLRNLVDLANLFQRVFLLKDQLSLGSAIGILGLEFQGVPHSALVDARNTATAHAALIRRMRCEADPPPTPVEMSVETLSLSHFGEMLRDCLGKK
jgi:inhibitor of KinA sporulation pathway (predicted exonuclease)